MKDIIKKSKEELVDLLESLKSGKSGKIFSVIFIKKDGSRRKLTGRFGVKSYLHNGKATVQENKYFIIFDLKIKEYRAVNKETIQSLCAFGEKFCL